ncbi:unnamed protein product, partial [Mesorhabditis spiculigera]
MSVNLSLDDIIAKHKVKRHEGGRGDRRAPRGGTGSGGRRGFESKTTVPGGKWKHDLFDRRGSPEAVRPAARNTKVRVLMSNLADTVTASDLEELFSVYNVESVVLHFNQQGESLGTGECTLRMADATEMLKELSGLAIDDKRVKMTLVDEHNTKTIGSLKDRVQLPKTAQRGNLHKTFGGGVRKGRSSPRGQKSGGKSWNEHDDRFGSTATEGSGSRGRGGRGRGGDKKKPMSEDELNRQLDEYMGVSKDNMEQ